MEVFARFTREVRRCMFSFIVRTTVSIVVIAVVLPLRLVADDGKAITIKSSLVNGNVVLVNGEVNGKAVQLECFLSVAHCKTPKEGDYVLVRFPRGKGPYMDCPNVYLYEQPAPSRRGQRIGEYCLLGE